MHYCPYNAIGILITIYQLFINIPAKLLIPRQFEGCNCFKKNVQQASLTSSI